MKISLIVAVSKNNVIGANGNLPWRMPADMAFFRRTTMDHCVIMGRKTFASLKQPLKRRYNIVVTHHPIADSPNCQSAKGVPEALDIAAKREENEVFVIGGASIYQQTLTGAERIYLTQIDTELDGDTYFVIPKEGWTEVSREEHPADEQNPFPYRFIQLDRVPS